MWHKQVPRERRENIIFRKKLLEGCRDNPARQKAMIEACRKDILFFVNAFIWQYNPKKKGREGVGPFLTFPFQEKALVGERGILWCYEQERTAVVEKSREMGATWLFLIFQLWLCLFHDYVQTINLSKNEDAVDSSSPNSLFFKIRFMLRYLPDWLKGPLVDQSLHFHFLRHDTFISGEPTTKASTVGGRGGVLFCDEFAKLREAKKIRESTAMTSDCRFFNSTHDGTSTEFYALTQTPEIVKMVWHWTEHPEKARGAYRYNAISGQIEILDKTYAFPPDFQFQYTEKPTGGPCPGIRSPWYDKKCLDIGSEQAVAIELDIDVGKSVRQFFDPLTIRNLTAAHGCPPVWEGDIDYDSETGQPLGLSEIKDGPLKLWIRPRADGSVLESSYAIGADVSEGSGATNSCLAIGDSRTGEMVAEYATAHMRPERLATLAVALCWVFCDEERIGARIGWETPGPGASFGAKLIELGYTNYYIRESLPGMSVKGSNLPGWNNSKESKRTILSAYRAALGDRTFVNHCLLSLEETKHYFYGSDGYVYHPSDGGNGIKIDDPTGARVNHGDRVIAAAICQMICKRLATGQVREKHKSSEQQVHPGTLSGRILLDRVRSLARKIW